MIVLGIETSCDETGIGLFDERQGLLGHRLHSQVKLHAPHGGVVPELASRDHVRHATGLVQQVLRDARIEVTDLDAVAYTAGPGLIGALLVGSAVANGLAWALEIPALPIHHMEAHLLAPLMERQSPVPAFPFIALLVSGGHTLLVRVEAVGCYRILGETLDDAVGEVFDKTATLLGLEYPGGPALSALAGDGRADRFHLTRPMINRPGLDFSFSGLKTQVRNLVERERRATGQLSRQTRADIAAAFEKTVVETLTIKCRRAMRQERCPRLVVSGGVSANQPLRAGLMRLVEELHGQLFLPATEFCTDNGAMIAHAGVLRFHSTAPLAAGFQPRPRWSLEDLKAPR